MIGDERITYHGDAVSYVQTLHKNLRCQNYTEELLLN